MLDPTVPQESTAGIPSMISSQDQEDPQDQEFCWNSEAENSVLEDLLKDVLPQHTMPDFYSNKLNHMPEGSKDIGWKHCLNVIQKNDADLCQAHREQIDTLLVFAGLFSAVVTAFAVESYQWLLDDPTDASAELLRDIVHLLAQSLNQTALPVRPTGARLPNAAITRINIFWFLALALSLSAALVGILCKQWLREFERDVGQAPETALGVRYHRYQGLIYWKVGNIVNSVPILLQISLALFLTGIVELLWRLHFTVAVCVTMVAGATLAFYMTTTLLPLLQYTYIILRLCGRITPGLEKYLMLKAFAEPQCAYKSAQAWITLRAVQPVIEYFIRKYCSSIFRAFSDDSLVLRPTESWVNFDINWMRRRDCIHWGAKSAYETLAWVAVNLDERDLRLSIWHCVWDCLDQRWNAQEGYMPEARDLACVAQTFPGPSQLDIDTRADIEAQAAVFRCSLQTTLSANTAVEMLLRIAPEIGVDSRWTSEAAQAICAVYRNVPIQLSNEMAVGLFRLANLQTRSIIQQSRASDSETSRTHSQGTRTFYDVFLLLLQATAENRERLLPAMCALALQWLRAHSNRIPPGGPGKNSNTAFAEKIAHSMITYYTHLSCDTARLHEYPGVIFPARLVAMVKDLSPHPDYYMTGYWASVFKRLVEISYANALTVAASASRSPPAASPAGPVPARNGEPSSHAPAPPIPQVPAVRDGYGERSPSPMRAQIDIHLDPDLNHVASPRGSPM